MKKIAIFASGNGTNAENIIRTFSGGNRVEVTCVVCNVRDAGVMGRAAALHVPTIYISNDELRYSPQELIAELQKQGVDLIVLAGFMRKIPETMVEAFPDRIINIHPSLLPAYGGKGMWGHHVHEAVIAAGEQVSGVTVHYVNNVMDGGRILMQESLPLAADETASSLEAKIHDIEYTLYPRAIVAALEEQQRTLRYMDKPEPSDGDEAREARSAEFEEEEEAEGTPGPVPPRAPETMSAPDVPPTPTNDMEWAEALKINFTPPAPNSVPPATSIPPRRPMQMGPRPVSVGQAPNMHRPIRAIEGNPSQQVKMPNNYLVWSILATLLCCIPLGIVSIIYAARVSSKYYAGDIEGAEKASRMAQIWIIASFVTGVVWYTAYFPIMLMTQMFIS